MTTEILLPDGRTFIHRHTAHCETGVTSALFYDKGLPISEPMALGIGSGLFFGHLPFVKMADAPLSAFRSQPGEVFTKTAERLGATFVKKNFRNPKEGMDVLRRLLKTGQIVALKTDLFWLPYLSERFRIHFNQHNVIALYEKDNVFRISDPAFEDPVDCPAEDLERARFARGPMESHGLMYYLSNINLRPDLRTACIKGIKEVCFRMLKIPIPLFGVRGIRFLARKTIKSPDKMGFDEACRQLAGIVRCVEETGTGGAGFRYMYAAFLQEAAELFGSSELAESAEEMTAIGDKWREFSVVASRIIKRRGKPEETFAKAGGLIMTCAGLEEEFYKNLQKVIGKLKA